ncbi:MAG: capsular polysaccharide synthesis protein [Actinomycetales bacterium]
MATARRPSPELIAAGLKAQLERSSTFIGTVDPVAATQTYLRLVGLLEGRLEELRLKAGLRRVPRPHEYWLARLPPARFADSPVPSDRVFTYWNQPLETAPPLVQACVAQLRRVYPQAQVLDGSSARQLIDIPDRIATLLEADRPAHFSDYVRTRVLAEHGGLWFDATIWVDRPLDAELSGYLRAGTVFPRWTSTQIGNWFIASHPGTPLITLQRLGLDCWWEANDDLPDYFLYHRIFDVMNRLVPEARGQWRATPVLSSAEAHRLQLDMMQPWNEQRVRKLLTQAPLQKLSYKYDDVPAGSVLEHLLGTAGTSS